MFHQRLSPQDPYRATVGQQALHRQAINKSGIIMKLNESPSIFPKQARDLRVLQEEELLPTFEDEPQDEQKPNAILMLSTPHCKTCNTRAMQAHPGPCMGSQDCEESLFYYMTVLLAAICDQHQWTVGKKSNNFGRSDRKADKVIK